MLSVFVPGKPVSINMAYGAGRQSGNRRYLTTEALAWRDSVSYITMQKLGTMGRPHGEIEVHCTFRGTHADADNLGKLTIDGLKYALHLDDRFFNPIVLAKEKLNGRERGCLIEIWERHEAEHGTEAVHDAERGPDSGAAGRGGDADRAAVLVHADDGGDERAPRAAELQRAARVRGGARGPAVGPRTAKRAS